jgi:hypothetical protein
MPTTIKVRVNYTRISSSRSMAKEIGIFKVSGVDTILIDSLTFGAQSNDIFVRQVSRWEFIFRLFPRPTPGTANVSGNLEVLPAA